MRTNGPIVWANDPSSAATLWAVRCRSRSNPSEEHVALVLTSRGMTHAWQLAERGWPDWWAHRGDIVTAPLVFPDQDEIEPALGHLTRRTVIDPTRASQLHLWKVDLLSGGCVFVCTTRPAAAAQVFVESTLHDVDVARVTRCPSPLIIAEWQTANEMTSAA